MKYTLRELAGRQPYEPVWQEMKLFTDRRDKDTLDEFWCLEHTPVFTLGQAGKEEHLLAAGDIPVVRTDRGGQVTYHGPGQLVVYLLIDIRRLGIGVRDLVSGIEHAVIRFLDSHGIKAEAQRKAPGVYVEGRKIAALGLRVRKGCSYHGLALNVDMDLAPFTRINPCGYEGLEVTDLKTLGMGLCIQDVAQAVSSELAAEFGYDGPPLIREA